MNEYHVTITGTLHVFADLIVMANSEEEALALAEADASADCIEWSDGDFDVDDAYIDTSDDFHSTQTIVQDDDELDEEDDLSNQD